jgi:hypothetical protein
MRSLTVCPRCRPIRACQSHRSTTAERTREPVSPTASAMSSQASSVRPTRTFAQSGCRSR